MAPSESTHGTRFQEEEEFIRTVSLKLEASKTQQYSDGNEFVSSELFRQAGPEADATLWKLEARCAKFEGKLCVNLSQGFHMLMFTRLSRGLVGSR